MTSAAPKPEALDHARPKVLHVHVGAFEQLPHQRRGRARCVKVELDALLVAVERLELRAVQAFLEAAERVAAPGRSTLITSAPMSARSIAV